MNKLVFLGILFFQIFTLSNIVNGQQDSLFQIISHGSRLEDKIDAHRRIMELLPRSEVDSLKLHFDAMLALSKQLNDENILESTYYDGIDFYYLNYAVQGANGLHEEFKNFLKKQNDTFDVINVLLKTQKKWMQSGYQGLLSIAKNFGLSISEVEVCLSDEKLIKLIESNMSIATNSFGINGTPSVFVNGKKISSLDYQEMLDEIK